MLLQTVLGIRAVMVSMIHSSDLESVLVWNERKEAEEARLAHLFEMLDRGIERERDRLFFEAARNAWRSFSEIQDQNADWMIKGDYEKVREGLINRGRERFKRVLGVIKLMDGRAVSPVSSFFKKGDWIFSTVFVMILVSFSAIEIRGGRANDGLRFLQNCGRVHPFEKSV